MSCSIIKIRVRPSTSMGRDSACATNYCRRGSFPRQLGGLDEKMRQLDSTGVAGIDKVGCGEHVLWNTVVHGAGMWH
jgi:hypothetical protein